MKVRIKQCLRPLAVLLLVFTGSCTSAPVTDANYSDNSGRVVVNSTDQDVEVYVGWFDTAYGEMFLVSAPAHGEVNVPDDIHIPSTETDYLVLTKTHDKLLVLSAQRYEAFALQGKTWSIGVESLANGVGHRLIIANGTDRELALYIGSWNGTSFSSKLVANVPPNAETEVSPNLVLTENVYCRVTAVYSQNNIIAYSNWYTAGDMENIGWRVTIPRSFGGVWDAVESFEIVNKGVNAVRMYVYHGDEIWKLSSEMKFEYVGSIDGLTSSGTTEQRYGGQIGRHYLTVVKAVSEYESVVFSAVLTEEKQKSLGGTIVIASK